MGHLEIKKLVLGSVSTNCYVVSNEKTKEAVIVDPADNPHRIRDIIETSGLKLKAILLTHGHFDHIMAVNDLIHMYHVPVYCHESEKDILENADLNLSSLMGSMGEYVTSPSHLLKDNDVLELLDDKIQVIYTPGHTKGGTCYYFTEEGCIFAGDTIFMESVGRTDFPTGNAVTLIRSIQEKLYTLNPTIKIYPGHGPATSIGYEKENNPYTSEELI